MMTQNRIPVLMRAVIARVQRELAKEHKKLRKLNKMPAYYLVDTWRNVVIREVDDIEAFAREIGVLYEYEELQGK
jgi:hypothetical protein